MKNLLNQLKKVAVVLTVGVICGAVAVAMLAPFGDTVARHSEPRWCNHKKSPAVTCVSFASSVSSFNTL